jgi:hypothetical protein
MTEIIAQHSQLNAPSSRQDIVSALLNDYGNSFGNGDASPSAYSPVPALKELPTLPPRSNSIMRKPLPAVQRMNMKFQLRGKQTSLTFAIDTREGFDDDEPDSTFAVFAGTYNVLDPQAVTWLCIIKALRRAQTSPSLCYPPSAYQEQQDDHRIVFNADYANGPQMTKTLLCRRLALLKTPHHDEGRGSCPVVCHATQSHHLWLSSSATVQQRRFRLHQHFQYVPDQSPRGL